MVTRRGSAVQFELPEILFPVHHRATNYYIDPQVEWDDPFPVYDGGTAYFDQWTQPFTRHPFPLAVFRSDPPFLEEYYDMGVNTLMEGNAAEAPYAAAMNSFGNVMDWWPIVGGPEQLRVQSENPAIDEQICGYLLTDEPDMFPYPAGRPDVPRLGKRRCG